MDRMIGLLHDVHREAREDGFDSVRVTGEMTWALSGAPGSERLLEYETRLNEALLDMRASAICQYDARRFPPKLLAELARVHPIVLDAGHVR